jgi:hypothetical protein
MNYKDELVIVLEGIVFYSLVVFFPIFTGTQNRFLFALYYLWALLYYGPRRGHSPNDNIIMTHFRARLPLLLTDDIHCDVKHSCEAWLCGNRNRESIVGSLFSTHYYSLLLILIPR